MILPDNPDFRPIYWEPSDPLQALLHNVKGRARREMITDFFNAGRADELEPGILGESRPEGFAKLEQISPLFMGGEYLPDYLPGEVEIARVELQSTTFDVISIRARPDGEGIHYRVVDEYETEIALAFETSPEPLTMQEMIAFIEGTCPYEHSGCGYGLNLVYCAANRDPAEAAELWDFAAVRSAVYPEIEDYFREVAEQWRDELLDDELEDEGGDLAEGSEGTRRDFSRLLAYADIPKDLKPINDRHIPQSDKWFRMCAGASTHLVCLADGVFELESSIADRERPISEAQLVTNIARSWHRNPELAHCHSCQVRVYRPSGPVGFMVPNPSSDEATKENVAGILMQQIRRMEEAAELPATLVAEYTIHLTEDPDCGAERTST